jgi:spore germination cell wall hydrolase CwlJ-like protein
VFKRVAQKAVNATEQNWFQLLLKNFCHAISTACDPRSKALLTLGCVLAVTSLPIFGANAAEGVSARELDCLATAIYFEARGEGEQGQMAVAQVILNRAASGEFPGTICGVVYQGESRRNACQFSFACDGIADKVKDRKAWAQAMEIAKKTTSGELYLAEVGDATHYHATYVYPHWAPKMSKITKVGLHVFYRFKPGWQFG